MEKKDEDDDGNDASERIGDRQSQWNSIIFVFSSDNSAGRMREGEGTREERAGCNWTYNETPGTRANGGTPFLSQNGRRHPCSENRKSCHHHYPPSPSRRFYD